MKPDVGQYWAPFVIRVASATIGQGINPYAAMYYGAINVDDNGTFVDDTLQGNGDTSGVLSGTVVQPGEAITVLWRGGVPGGRVLADLYGQSSDTPPSQGFSVPQIMGPHFFAKPRYPQAWQAPGNMMAVNIFFDNPGPAGTVVIIPPVGATTQLFLHSMQWHWSVANNAVQGNWINNVKILGSEAASDLSSRYLNWKGLQLNYGDNFSFTQTGGAVAATSRCFGTVVYALQNFVTP
jgi:hypothetical protein